MDTASQQRTLFKVPIIGFNTTIYIDPKYPLFGGWMDQSIYYYTGQANLTTCWKCTNNPIDSIVDSTGAMTKIAGKKKEKIRNEMWYCLFRDGFT